MNAPLENAHVSNAPDWERVSVALPFRLGEIGLFSACFEGLAYQRHFTKVEAFHSLPEPPLETAGERFVLYPRYPIASVPPVVARVGDWIAYTPHTSPNCYVDLARVGTFDAYLRLFSAKSRSTLTRKVKKFATASGGEIRWTSHANAAELERFFEHARVLSARTYQERLLGSGLPDDAAFRSRAAELADRGGARGFLLYLEGKAVAYVFSFCRDRIMTYDYVGYDPDAAALSPGTVLQYLLLEALFRERSVDIFDFTEGEGQHKAFFATDEIRCAKTYYFRQSLKHALIARSHYALDRGVEAVGAALDRFGLKAAVRKLIRKAA